jgi:hypothetical protein
MPALEEMETMLLRTSATILGALLAIAPLVRPAICEPAPTDLLFKQKQMDLVGRGDALTYKFNRKVSDEKLLGPAFSDDIRVGVTKINEKGEREVTLDVFSGNRAQDQQSYPDLTINPIFLWYLDRTVKHIAGLTGANSNYLKGRFRGSFDDKGKVELIKLQFGGKPVNGYKVSIMPYVDDPNASKMRGYNNSKFDIIVSDQVPGYFVELKMAIESPNKGTPKIEETLGIDGLGETK